MTDSAYKPHSLVFPLGEHKLLALIPPCCLDSAKSLCKQTQVTMQEVGVSHKQNTDICSLINKDLDGQYPKVWFSLITKQNTFSICNALPTPNRKKKPHLQFVFHKGQKKREMQSFWYQSKRERKLNIQVAQEKLISCKEIPKSRSPLKSVDARPLRASGSELFLSRLIKQSLDPCHTK